MPCYEVRTVSVEFHVENRKLLDAAIKSIGCVVSAATSDKIVLDYGAVTVDLAAGKALVKEGYQNNLNKLKQTYSKECVKAATKKCQWAVKFQGNNATVTKVQW